MSEERRRLSKNYLASGNQCCVLSCKISRRRVPNAKLFKFPPPASVFGQIWREKCNVPQGDYYKHLYVCDKHFESTYLGSRRLKGDAIPTLFLGRQNSQADNFELNLKQNQSFDCYRLLLRRNQNKNILQKEEENQELPQSAINMEATDEVLPTIKSEIVDPEEMEANPTPCASSPTNVDEEFFYSNIKSENQVDHEAMNNQLQQYASEMEETNDAFSAQKYDTIMGEEISTSSTQCSASTANEDELLLLLKEWKLERVYEHLLAESVTIDVLKIIKIHHLERLLNDLDIGTQVYFEYNLEKWRESIGAPLLNMYSEASLFRPRREQTTVIKSKSPPPLVSTVKNVNSKCITSLPEQENHKRTTLSKVLNSSRGRLLIEYYNNCQEFNEEHRIALICIIAQYFDNKNIQMSLRDSYILEREIIERFPTEKLEYYRERLYNKFCNIRNVKKGINPNLLQNKRNASVERSTNMPLVAEENAEQMVKAVRDDKLTFSEMEHNWRACSRYRIIEMQKAASIKTILHNWPQYKLPHGHQLIDIDFNILFPNNPTILDTWHLVENALFDILSNMSNLILRDALKNFETLSRNSKEALLLWSTHACLVPFQRNENTNIYGNNYYSTIHSQAAFIMQYATMEALQHAAHMAKERCASPFLMVLGNFSTIKQIYVYFEGITMQFDNCLKAVDICFKIYHLFSLTYPSACESFWTFIQTYFYKMNCKESFLKVNILCNALKKFN